MDDLKNKSQKELEQERWNSPIDSERYKRANDLILQIQHDTNNIQTAKLIQESKKGSDRAEKNSLWAIRIAVLSLIITAYLQIHSNNQAQHALELSAEPVISITEDRDKLPGETDEVTLTAGLIPKGNSRLHLILKDNSLSTLEDVDIRMTLWQIYVDSQTKHLNICPVGYINHKNNPNFIISSLNTDNIFNKTFSLKKDDKYPFTLDISNIDSIVLEPKNSQLLLRIEVAYRKSVSQTTHNYVKLYDLNSSAEYVVDVDVAPDLALALNDKKNEGLFMGFKFPSVVYPFQEEEFLEYFRKPVKKLNLQPNSCRDFTLLKEQKVITY